jgi:malate synthase
MSDEAVENERRSEEILTPEAVRFLVLLHRTFDVRRRQLLRDRRERQGRIDDGELPHFRPDTAHIRDGDWRVAPLPHDLRDRRVEITGPVDRKMIINALNSGANVFMADFEDSNAPTWTNNLRGQVNLRDAVRGTIAHEAGGKSYRLADRTAVLMVRPRGWHLVEAHLEIDGTPVSASLFDFGLYFFHNARALIERGTGPYFYLPKLESHLEARLWNDVFVLAQDELGIPRGTIKATVLVETLPAAFEMHEILHELRDHSAGLNCGRWDYIFSFIKSLRNVEEATLPDRGQVTMTVPNMRAYTRECVRVCHRRGTHAMGGMAAQIPIRGDEEANRAALELVRRDKLREVMDGHDGTWVAHPGLIPVARAVFDEHMPGPNQIERAGEEDAVHDGSAEERRAAEARLAAELLRAPEGTITERGLRLDIRVGVRYLEAWLGGLGCVPLYNLMEDAATAEISRSQVWQWIRSPRGVLEDGRVVSAKLVERLVDEEMAVIRAEVGEDVFEKGRFALARRLFEEIVLDDEFEDFLTLKAYEHIVTPGVSRIAAPVVSQVSAPVSSAVAAPDDASVPPAVGAIRRSWEIEERWRGVVRDYTEEDVARLRGSLPIEHTLARRGAERLWRMLGEDEPVRALGALTGNQAVQMVKAGLRAIYLSGWQVAADANLGRTTYPDQSLYPVNSVPDVVRRINNALQRADQIHHAEGANGIDWFAPIVADAEAGFGGALNAFELMKAMVEAGAAGVHFEDQLASEKKCGHMGGKVCVPTRQFIRTLKAARLAADVCGVPTLVIARTDSKDAKLLTSDIDESDREFLTGERTAEGFFHVRPGLDTAIKRARAYAPYADVLWCESQTPDLAEAKRFAEAVHEVAPGKLLAYNCSPSFNWKANLDDATIARFQRELAAMGYRFQFVTLAGFHALNFSAFQLARAYRDRHMTAYVELQEAEFAAVGEGYTATKHQREVGAGYFDAVAQAVAGGAPLVTAALAGSSEEAQFRAVREDAAPASPTPASPAPGDPARAPATPAPARSADGARPRPRARRA